MGVTGNQKSKRITTDPEPKTQVSSRSDIFNQDAVDEEALKEEQEKMDMIMRRLMGGVEEEDQEDTTMDETKQESENEQEEEFSFRLFASQPVATVTIADGKDDTDNLSKQVADQQVYEFDETDPEFLARVNQVAVDYDTIMKQSTIVYPPSTSSRRVIHILSPEEQAKKDEAEKKKNTKKRKSKKCRDFEKAVKEGKIKLAPNMRNPSTPNGWPGWPGILTRVAIVDYKPSNLKRGHAFGGNAVGGRGGFRGRGASRGSSRGGSGGMTRGRGRGRAF